MFPLIVGFAGASEVGKDKAADYMVEQFGYEKYELKTDLIKEVNKQYDLDPYKLRGQTPEDKKWRRQPQPTLAGRCPLDIMIDIGERRRELNPTYWLDLLMASLREPLEKQPIVISDVRRFAEADRIRQLGLLLYLERGNPTFSKAERELEQVKQIAFRVINNNESLGALYVRINGSLRLWASRTLSSQPSEESPLYSAARRSHLLSLHSP
jgi:hypothetical protein